MFRPAYMQESQPEPNLLKLFSFLLHVSGVIGTQLKEIVKNFLFSNERASLLNFHNMFSVPPVETAGGEMAPCSLRHKR